MSANRRAAYNLLGLSSAMMLVLVACGVPAQPQSTTAPSAPQATQAPAATEAPAAPAQPVTIRASMWESADALEPYNKAKEAFEKKYPNIKVQLESVPQDYGTKLLTQLAAGTAPDVFQVGDGDVAKLVSKGVIDDLEPYLAAD